MLIRDSSAGAWCAGAFDRRAELRYKAETDLVKMATRVVEERELQFISRVREDLGEAKRLAESSGKIAKDRLGRLSKMTALADHTEKALRLFIKTAQLDVGGMFGVFRPKE